MGWTGLVGGTLFEIGAYCMVVEAVNRGNAVHFGYEVRARHATTVQLRPFAGWFHSQCHSVPTIQNRTGVSGVRKHCEAQVRHLLEAGLTQFYPARGRDADFYSPTGSAPGQVQRLSQFIKYRLPLAYICQATCSIASLAYRASVRSMSRAAHTQPRRSRPVMMSRQPMALRP